VNASRGDGATIERAAFLAVEAQPKAGLSRRSLLLLGGVGGTLCAGIPALLALGLLRRRRKRKSVQSTAPAE
jgi:hypothetical protein